MKGVDGMDKKIKTAAIIAYVLLAVNIWMTLSLSQQVSNLQNQINAMRSESSNEFRQANNNIDTLRSDLEESIRKGESLLSSFESEAEYKDGQILYTVRLVPKEISPDGKIFLTIDTERQEAISSNGAVFEAVFALAQAQAVTPVVSFESPDAVKQEALPEEDLAVKFSLGYDVDWDYSNDVSEKLGEIILFTVHARSAADSSLLSSVPSADVIIKDAYTDTEIGRAKMQIKDAAYQKEIVLYADLGEYREKEGSYTVWVEMKTEGGIFYRDQISSFSNEYSKGGSIKSARVGGSGGILYPVW